MATTMLCNATCQSAVVMHFGWDPQLVPSCFCSTKVTDCLYWYCYFSWMPSLRVTARLKHDMTWSISAFVYLHHKDYVWTMSGLCLDYVHFLWIFVYFVRIMTGLWLDYVCYTKVGRGAQQCMHAHSGLKWVSSWLPVGHQGWDGCTSMNTVSNTKSNSASNF